MSAYDVIEARRAEQAALLELAREFAFALDSRLGVRAVVVVGSVARGDFHAGSDIDVIVVADQLPEHPLRRLEVLGEVLPGVEAVVWTPTEWRRARVAGNPLAAEATTVGIWLIGSDATIENRATTANGQRDGALPTDAY